MSPEFEFKKGMEFISIKQFKDAVKEHDVLNGRETRYLKNEKTRCKITCKKSDSCWFILFCSKVAQKETYMIKTCKPKHTCGRVFKNKSAAS